MVNRRLTTVNQVNGPTATLSLMLAIVQDTYGSPAALRLTEVERPAVADDEVLVRVKASSAHPDIWHVVTGRPAVLRLMGAGLRRPRVAIPGTDVAGVVEAVGASVTRFRPGDEVFGLTLRGMMWVNGGAFAEYAAVRQDGLEIKPGNVSFEQAATVPMAGFISLLNVPREWLGAGRRVLVNGAAGGVGALVLQIAKAHGSHVTGVDATAKLDVLRELGADEVIDYTREDYTVGDKRFDLIVDIPGNHSFPANERVLAASGKYILIGHDHYGTVGRAWVGSIPRMLGLVVRSRFNSRLRVDGERLGKREAMEALRGYLEAGQVTPVIERTFPLAEAGHALEYLAGGKALGRIVITI